MARHTKKQIEILNKRIERKARIQTFLITLPKVLLLLLGIYVVIYLGLKLYNGIKTENYFLNQCNEMQEYVDKDVCKKALYCARDKVGYEKLMKYDKEELNGSESLHVAKVITKCTLHAMLDEVED